MACMLRHACAVRRAIDHVGWYVNGLSHKTFDSALNMHFNMHLRDDRGTDRDVLHPEMEVDRAGIGHHTSHTAPPLILTEPLLPLLLTLISPARLIGCMTASASAAQSC